MSETTLSFVDLQIPNAVQQGSATALLARRALQIKLPTGIDLALALWRSLPYGNSNRDIVAAAC